MADFQLVSCMPGFSFDFVGNFSWAEGLHFNHMVIGHMFRFNAQAIVSGLRGLTET